MKSALLLMDTGRATRDGRDSDAATLAVNSHLADCLLRHGYAVDTLNDVPAPAEHDQLHRGAGWVPLHAADLVRRLRARPPADLVVYESSLHWIEALDLCRSKRSMMFVHAFNWSSFIVWLLQRKIDVLCANSVWTYDVITALGGSPVWNERRLLCPDMYGRARWVTLPVPALDHPEGADGGARIPPEVWGLFDRADVVLGTDFCFESDAALQCALMLALNVVARQHDDGRRFRLVAPEPQWTRLEQRLLGPTSSVDRGAAPAAAMLRALGLTLRDLYVGVQAFRIAQSDLFRLMRQSRFTLAFHNVPESFGRLPLESVLQDCPVYSNGAGNLRFLLPEGHGLSVHDSIGLAEYSIDEILRIAGLIYQDVRERERDPNGAHAERLRAGKAYIRQRYSARAFEDSVTRALDDPSPPIPSFDLLRLAPSLLARQWQPGGVRIVSDRGIIVLMPDEAARIPHLLGRSATELFDGGEADQRLISKLWAKGVLAWNVSSS